MRWTMIVHTNDGDFTKDFDDEREFVFEVFQWKVRGFKVSLRDNLKEEEDIKHAA